MQSACAVFYCHLSSVRLYNIFTHNLINGDFLKQKTINERKTCVVIFSTTSVRILSHSKKNRARYDQICILVYQLILSHFNQICIFLIDFRKILKYQI